MFAMKLNVLPVIALAMLGLTSVTARADDAAANATLAEIQSTLGFVPSFVSALPKAALPGAWAEARDLIYSDTALDAKTKALIGLAVAAQIPCEYCIFDDTNGARRAGATDEQIKEAIAVAAMTRYYSTIFHGNQVDLATFKHELGGM
jgi:AhpD family alkylhydroperoxidase